MKEVLGIICFIFSGMLFIASKDYQYFGESPELMTSTLVIKLLLLLMGFIVAFSGFYIVISDRKGG
tara:strand:- start:449 stop:646 length:198 start_codon:yes stop_codon:yes gene_type:complete